MIGCGGWRKVAKANLGKNNSLSMVAFAFFSSEAFSFNTSSFSSLFLFDHVPLTVGVGVGWVVGSVVVGGIKFKEGVI